MDGRQRTQTPEGQLFRVSKIDLCRSLLSFPPVFRNDFTLWLPVWPILLPAMHTITVPQRRPRKREGRICLTKEQALLKWDKGHSLHRSCP